MAERLNHYRRLLWCGEHRFSLQISPDEPPMPGPQQVLLRVRAVGICGTDVHIMNGRFPWVRPPRVLGHEIAADVIGVGPGVKRVQVGQRVTVDSVVGCGECFFCRRGSAQFCVSGYELGLTADGGCQDYLLVPERNVYPIGPSVSYEEAAILDMEIWGAIRKAGIRHSDRVLVIGHGPAGLLACQVAHLMGAEEVILCGRSPDRLTAAKRLGVADRYVSVDEEELTAVCTRETDGRGVDLAIDCAGTERSTTDALRVVTPGGRVLLYGVYEQPLRDTDLNRVVLKDLTVYGALSDRVGWEEVITSVESGALDLKSLITHKFQIEDAPAAYDLAERKADGIIKTVLLL